LRTPEIDPELARGRGKVASTIFVAHAIKHIYNSGHSSLIMPEIKIDLGLSRAQYGSLGTASSIAWWASTMVAGYLGDRFTNRAGIMLAIALGLMGGSFFVAGFAPNYTTMLAVIFLAGIGPALFHPPAIGELSRRFPDRRGFAVSLHGMAANIGEVLGAPTVAVFLMFMVWRDLLKISAGPALLVAFAILLLMPSRKGEAGSHVSSIRGYFTSLVSLLNNRVLLLLIIATALRSVGEGAVGGFLSLYMRDDLNYSVTTVAIFLSAAQIAGVVSQPVMGILSDKIGRKPVLVTGTGLVMLSAFALSVARSGVQLFLAVLVKGAFSFSLHHIFVAAALDASRGGAQSTVVSLIYGAGFLGTFSPYIAGLISDHYGIHSAFLYGGAVLILPTVLLAVARFPSPAPVMETEPEGSD
jgi:MFS family permease